MFPDRPPARAHVEFDYTMGGVRFSVMPNRHSVVLWQVGAPTLLHLQENEAVPDEYGDLTPWCRLDEDSARALYHALGEYFGGNAYDVRQLRADYNAERDRVDKALDHLIRMENRHHDRTAV